MHSHTSCASLGTVPLVDLLSAIQLSRYLELAKMQILSFAYSLVTWEKIGPKMRNNSVQEAWVVYKQQLCGQGIEMGLDSRLYAGKRQSRRQQRKKKVGQI